jgi:hypothetical protein
MNIKKLINYSTKLCQNLPGYYSRKYRRREGLKAIPGVKPLGTRAGAQIPKASTEKFKLASRLAPLINS